MRLNLNGISINYVVEGEGPWVTMSHSLACDLHMWDEEARRLSRDHTVLRFDTRGHGASDAPPGPYSLQMLVDDVRRLLAKLGVRETHFVGLSMGGMIGQVLALDHPELVRSLVLCDTSCNFTLDVEERARIVGSGGLAAMVEPTLARFLSEPFRKRFPDVVEKVAATIRSTPAAGYLGCCHAVAGMALGSRVGAIRCPTLVVVGENDMATPLAMAREIHEAIRGSELFVVPQAAHLANLEQPDVFNDAVARFLAKHAGGATVRP